MKLSMPSTIHTLFEAVDMLPAGIEHLDCTSCSLNPDGFDELSKRLESHTQLRTLLLGENAGSTEGMTALALALRGMPDLRLETLDVGANQIGDDGVNTLCSNIATLSTLRCLRLEQNSLSATGARVIASSLDRFRLHELYLDRNGLGEAGARHLADAIGRAGGETLRVLSVSENGIQDKGVQHLASVLGHNSQLTTLILGQKNRIKGAGLRTLARALSSNRRSALRQLVCYEGAMADQVELLFSLRRTVQDTQSHAAIPPALDFGRTLHADPRDHEVWRDTARRDHEAPSDRTPRPQALRGALYDDEAVRFFRAPLTFCVSSLSSCARMDELAAFLIADRNARAHESHISPLDAQCAVIEAIVLEDANDRRSMLELMLWAGGNHGVRKIFLPDQTTKVARLLSPHDAQQRSPTQVRTARLTARSSSFVGAINSGVQREGETVCVCNCQREGELWQHSVRWPTDEDSAGRELSVAEVRHVEADDRLHAHRDVEIKEDLWLTAHPIVVKQQAGDFLSEQARLSAAGGRTALLLALHAGREDAAAILARRLHHVRCEWRDSVKKTAEDHTLLLLEVTEQTRERLARLGVHAPSSECKWLLLPQWPDVVGLGVAEQDEDGRVEGAEALRVAAVRGMAGVVGSLLQWRRRWTCAGMTDVPPYQLSGAIGMRDTIDAHGRNLLHDVCRNLLPRGEWIRLEAMHAQLLEFATQILELSITWQGRSQSGKKFAYDKDAFGRLPIHYAAAFGHLGLLRLFIDKEVHRQLDLPDNKGWTPLGLAVSNGHLRCAVLLRENNADPLQPQLSKTDRRPSVPCPYVLVLLRLHFEEELRHQIRRVDEVHPVDGESCRVDGESGDELKSPSPMHAGATATKGGATSARNVRSLRSTLGAVPGSLRAFVSSLCSRTGPYVRLNDDADDDDAEAAEAMAKSTLDCRAQQCLAPPESFKQDRARRLAEELNMQVLLPSRSAQRFRYYFLFAEVGTAVSYFLTYLLLLTSMALSTGTGALWPSSATTSLPYSLQASVGTMVSKEEYRETVLHPQQTFAKIENIEHLHGFLDPATGPLFSVLFSNPWGNIDEHNQLLGAVRIRLQRHSLNSACPSSWLHPDGTHDCMNGGAMDTHDFVGRSSGQPYHFARDGVYGGTDWPANHFFFYGDDRSRLGLQGYVIDIHPSNLTHAAAAVQGLLDDELLNDRATRALFIDFTVFNRILTSAVPVHLTVEVLPTGWMVSRTDAVLLPLYAPFASLPNAALFLLEVVVSCLNVVNLKTEGGQFRADPINYMNAWNILDLLAIGLLLLWNVMRIRWWTAYVFWGGLDASETGYIGTFQPLASHQRKQQSLLSIALILSWFRLQDFLRDLPHIGPVLIAMFTTLFSFQARCLFPS